MDIEDLKGKSGIYMWTSPSGKRYVGQAVDLKDRHRKFLTKGVYSGSYGYKQSKIEQARNKYPDLSLWKYEVLEYCPFEQLNEKEAYWVAYYNTFKEGYNSTLGGDNGYIPDEETRKKQSEARLKYLANGGTTWNKGGHLSEETKQQLSRSHIKNAKTVYGYDLETGVLCYIFDNASTAAKALGIINANIVKCCDGRRRQAGNIFWQNRFLLPKKVKELIEIKKQGTHNKLSTSTTKRLLDNHPNGRPLVEVKKDGSIRYWKNAGQAGKYYGFTSSCITNGFLRGLRRSHGSTWYLQSEIDNGIAPVYLERSKENLRPPKTNKKVIAILNDGTEILFNSIKESEDFFGLGRGSVSKVLSPKAPHKTAGGIRFKYA